ncbi:MAG: endonuclease III, partial [Brevundimonas sp.]
MARAAKPLKPILKRPSVMTGPSVRVLGWPPDEDRVEAIFERLSAVMPEPK